MTDEQDIYTAAQAREYVDGYLERDPVDVTDHSGIVRDEHVARQMDLRAIHHNPEQWDRPDMAPGDYRGVTRNDRVIRAEGAETFREAMANGDMTTLKFFPGSTSERADISGINAIERVDDLVTGPAPIIIILGRMGSGKTSFAGLLGQRWAHHKPGDAVVGSNIRSLREVDEWVDQEGRTRDGWINNYPDLKEWAQQDGDPLDNPQTPKLFIGDEFSSAASGRGKEGYETAQKMAPLIFKIRKYGGAMIYIAHGPKSIHPMMWRVGTIVKKVSKKEAIIAGAIRNSKVADIQGRLEGVPDTDWRFRTEEASAWSWHRQTGDDGEEDVDEREVIRETAIYTAIRCKQDGLSNADTAAYVPYSQEWVRQRWNEYQDENEHAEVVGKVEEAIA